MSAFNVGKKVSAAIRILQRNRDASARATHLVVKKDPLIPYEKALLGQATGGKFPSVTFLERKKMSTKTSIKRIAAVAAVALTLGGFSAVSANAAVLPNGTITAITGSSVTASPTVGTAVYVKAGVTVAALTPATGTNDTVSLTAALTSFPTGGSTAVSSNTAAGATPAGTATPIVPTASTATTSAAAGLVTVTTTTLTTWAAQTVTYLGGFNFTPTKAGTYVLTIWNDTDGNGVVNVTEVQQTVSITAAASAGFSSGATTVFMAAGNGGAVITANGTNTAATKSMAITNRFQGTVNLKNTSNALYTSGASLSVTASGVGGVAITDSATPTANQCSATTVVRTNSITTFATGGGIAHFYGCSDGTAGTGTLTVKFTDADGVTSYTLATYTVTYYSAASAFSVSTTNFTIGKAGTQTGNGTFAGRTAAGEALSPIDQTTANGGGNGTTVPAFIVKAVDSSGNLAVSTNTVSGKSSDTTVVSSAACVLDDGSSTTYSSGTGVGYYNCSFTTAANAKSGATATITFRAVDPADATGATYITAAPVTVTVGEKVAKTTLTSDASTYSVGSPMVVTFTATDSSGKPVYDGAASPASVTASKALGGAAGFTGYYVGGVDASASSLAKSKLYAPSLAGDFKLTATDSALNALSLTLTAGDDAASGTSSLALDAANAATDAANNAYDEAQNATQAASDALAAVTALSAQVEALIATVKSLAAMVAKIKAKVKA